MFDDNNQLLTEVAENSKHPWQYRVYTEERLQMDVVQVWYRQDHRKYGGETTLGFQDQEDNTALVEYKIRNLFNRLDSDLLVGDLEEIPEGSEFRRY